MVLCLFLILTIKTQLTTLCISMRSHGECGGPTPTPASDGRMTKPSVINERTKNTNVVSGLLAQSSTNAILESFGIKDESALDLAKTINV